MSCNWAQDILFSELAISRESSRLPEPLWIFFTNFLSKPFTIWQFLGKSEKFSKFLRTETDWFAGLRHSRIYEEAKASDHFQHQLLFHLETIIASERAVDFPMNYWIRLRQLNVSQLDWKLSKCQTSNWKYKIEKIKLSGVASETNKMLPRTKTQSRSVKCSPFFTCDLWDISYPAGWLTVGPQPQTTPTEERLWVWQFLSPGYNGYV